MDHPYRSILDSSFFLDKNHNIYEVCSWRCPINWIAAWRAHLLLPSKETFLGGPSCKLLTKSAIFQNPENNGSILVCTGDEASKSALVSSLGQFFILMCLKQKTKVLCDCTYLHMCICMVAFFIQVTLYWVGQKSLFFLLVAPGAHGCL